MKNEHLKNFIYIDPDQGYLQALTGYKEILQQESASAAYTKYRDASNFLAYFFLSHAVARNYNIIHGTTGTNPRVTSIYSNLKEKFNYEIHIKLLFAPALSRIAAIEERDKQGAANVTPEDMVIKVNPVFERLNDAYLKYANSLEVIFNLGQYWIGEGQLCSTIYYPESTEPTNQYFIDIISKMHEAFPTAETEQYIKFMQEKGLITGDEIINSNDNLNIKPVFS